MAWSAKEPEAEEEPEWREVCVEGRGREVELEERVLEEWVTDETEGRDTNDTEEVRMAELELAEEETEFKDLVDKIGETAGGGVRLISGDRERQVTVEVLGGKTDGRVRVDVREEKKTELEGQVTVDVLEERQVETDVIE